MTALVIEGGVVSWAPGRYATAEQADAYASDREWTDWAAATPSRRLAALLDASTFIRFAYEPPKIAGTITEEMITDATIEAARLSLAGPLTGGNAAAEPQLIRKKTGPLEKEWAAPTVASARQASNNRLSLVHSILAAAGARRKGGVNVSLSKS